MMKELSYHAITVGTAQGAIAYWTMNELFIQVFIFTKD
jgi:hypothetical protein